MTAKCWNCGEEVDADTCNEYWYHCCNCEEPQGDNSSGLFWKKKCIEARELAEKFRDSAEVWSKGQYFDGELDRYPLPWRKDSK